MSTQVLDCAPLVPDPATEPTISVVRAGRILGISRRTAYAMAERGDMPVIRCGRKVRVPSGRFREHFGI